MRGSASLHIFFFWSFTLLTFFSHVVKSADTLNATQSLGINQALVSPRQVYEFGFFNSSNSNWYLGIWFKGIPDKTVVWVANRDTPLQNSTGSLKIGNRGNLLLIDQVGNFTWSSNETTARNPILQLLDTGNLILREENDGDNTNPLWQSFDYPTDTLLPGMKLGWNLDTGVERRITSWKSNDDPSTGDVYFSLEYRGIPEIFLWNQKQRKFRTGPWNGKTWNGVPVLDTIAVVNDKLIENEHEVYYIPSGLNQSSLSKITVNSSGQVQRLAWIGSSQSWNSVWFAPHDDCDNYGQCGPFGICDSNAFPVCECIDGFTIKNQQQWNLRNFSDGCVRKTKLDCGNDGFSLKSNVQLPDTTTVFVNMSMNLLECKIRCLSNCNCTAYANTEITNGGSGCVIWTDELLDVRQFSGGGQDLYVRLAASDVGDSDTGTGGGSDKKRNVGKIAGISVSSAVIILGVISIFILCKKRKLQNKEQSGNPLLMSFTSSSIVDTIYFLPCCFTQYFPSSLN